MKPHELYDIWAPQRGRWSPWVKPVLFLHMQAPRDNTPALPEVDVSWAPRVSENTALIIDAPGALPIAYALALAKRGYRPAPLHNTHPHRTAAIEIDGILRAMQPVTAELQRLRIDDDAPPAFLLDAHRLKASTPLRPRVFDNRWMVFPQDFPSAGFMLSHGVRSAIVVQETGGQPREDLRHVLLRWQEAGMSIAVQRTNAPAGPEPIVVSRPPRFRAAWQRWLAMFGLRRNSAGGFGSIIPEPSSGGSGFA